MKRVFIQSTARGKGLSRQLIENILAEARKADGSRICLGVLPEFTAAQAIDRSLGFQQTAPGTFTPVIGTEFLNLQLFASRSARMGCFTVVAVVSSQHEKPSGKRIFSAWQQSATLFVHVVDR